jgi:hypothetical protein
MGYGQYDRVSSGFHRNRGVVFRETLRIEPPGIELQRKVAFAIRA